ncbi:MAG: hypothetical protein WCS65_11535 [Verrucomicrobiae bacterium]
MNRDFLFRGLAFLLAVALAVRLLWPDGLISLDFKEAPLAKVIASIERQGGVRIVTNVPPETPVTMQMRAPLMEVLETLSVRIESELRAVYVGAAELPQALAAFDALKSGKAPEEFAVSWFPAMGMPFGGGVSDPRSLVVRFEPAEPNSLQSALQQLAQKSGVMTAVPLGWNPKSAPAAKPAAAASAVRQAIASSGGHVVEGFLLWNRGGWQAEGRGQGGEGRRQGEGGPDGGQRGGREAMNPEWAAQRTEAMIAQLPKDEQPAAKAEFDATRKVWEEIRALPEDQRRAKMEEIFNRPEVQDRMAARAEARDARRTPAQREKRMKSYVERKKQMKAQNP